MRCARAKQANSKDGGTFCLGIHTRHTPGGGGELTERTTTTTITCHHQGETEPELLKVNIHRRAAEKHWSHHSFCLADTLVTDQLRSE